MTTSPSPSSSPSTSFEVESAALLKILLHGAKHPSSDVLGVLLGRPPKEAASSDGIDVDASAPTPSVSGRVVDALPLFHGPMLYGPMLEVALLQVNEMKESQKENRSKNVFPPKFGPASIDRLISTSSLVLSLSLSKKKKKKAAAHAKSRDLSLLGVYAANELLSDDRLKPAARAAAEAVARGSGSGGGGGGGSVSCCVLLVNNGALTSFSEGKADPEAGDVLSLWLKKSGGGGGGAAQGGWERVSPPSSSSSSAAPPAPLLRGAGGEERAKLFAQAVAKGLVDRVHDFDDHLLDLKKDWLNPGLLA